MKVLAVLNSSIRTSTLLIIFNTTKKLVLLIATYSKQILEDNSSKALHFIFDKVRKTHFYCTKIHSEGAI